MNFKIDREKLDKIYKALCPVCSECKYRDKSRLTCRNNAISDILEQHPELIQTEPVLQIPVKKIWKLKKEASKLIQFATHMVGYDVSSEPVPEELSAFYDLTETHDYSKIPVGAVIEVVDNIDKFPNYGIVTTNSHEDIIIQLSDKGTAFERFSYNSIKSLTILKLPKDIK